MALVLEQTNRPMDKAETSEREPFTYSNLMKEVACQVSSKRGTILKLAFLQLVIHIEKEV